MKIKKNGLGGACSTYLGEERRGPCSILMGKPERRKPLWIPRLRWENSNEMDLQGVWWEHGLE